MTIIDYINIAYKNLSRRKKYCISSFILIFIAVIVSILLLTFSKGIRETIDKAINNNLSYRTIVISGIKNNNYNYLIKEISNINHIVEVKDSEEYTTYAKLCNIEEKYENNIIEIIGSSEKSLPAITNGNSIRDENECIVPEKIYLDYLSDKFNKNEYINGIDLIGKEIKIEYYSYDESDGIQNRKINKTFEKKLKVVGTYDSFENVMNGCSIFSSYNCVKEINNNIKENFIKNNETIYVESKMIMAIVDKAENLEECLINIQALNVRAIPRSIANTTFIKIINVITIIVLSIFIILISIILILSNVKSINNRKSEMGMLKAIGYKNINIKNILIYENMIIQYVSYIFGLISSYILIAYIKNNYISKNTELYQIKLNINIYFIIITFLILVTIPLFIGWITIKNTIKNSPIDLKRES